jgi:hypothetical protein
MNSKESRGICIFALSCWIYIGVPHLEICIFAVVIRARWPTAECGTQYISNRIMRRRKSLWMTWNLSLRLKLKGGSYVSHADHELPRPKYSWFCYYGIVFTFSHVVSKYLQVGVFSSYFWVILKCNMHSSSTHSIATTLSSSICKHVLRSADAVGREPLQRSAHTQDYAREARLVALPVALECTQSIVIDATEFLSDA